MARTPAQRAQHARRERDRRERVRASDVALALAWNMPADKRTEAQQQLLEQGPPPRAAPTQHEAAEMGRLARMVRSRWWWPAWWHHEAAGWDDRETRRRKREGVRPGWPDCELHLPSMPGRVGAESVWPINAAIELKRPDLRPKREVADEWWLMVRDQRSHYGCSADQIATLQSLAECGWLTRVAYGADEAIAWLDSVAGEAPAALPRSWLHWTEPAL